MNYIVYQKTGDVIKVTGDFRGVNIFKEKLIAPAIELDRIDENGKREWLLVDPRCLIIEQIDMLVFKVVYNPREYMKHLSKSMLKTMKSDTTWPQRILGSLS